MAKYKVSDFSAFIKALKSDMHIEHIKVSIRFVNNPIQAVYNGKPIEYVGICRKHTIWDFSIKILNHRYCIPTSHTIAHELRHCWQFTNGHLTYALGNPVWQGAIVNTTVAYNAQQHEMDANTYAESAIARFNALLPHQY